MYAGICAQGTAYSTPGTVQPMTCLPQLGTVGCPPNYNCQFSATSQQYYCCPSNTQAQSGCPVNTQPLTNTAGSQICNLFDPNSCPQPYKCTQSTINPSQSICCTTTTSSSSSTTAKLDYNLYFVYLSIINSSRVPQWWTRLQCKRTSSDLFTISALPGFA